MDNNRILSKRKQMMRQPPLSIILVLWAAACTLAACGGSNDQPNTLNIVRPAPPAAYAGRANPFAGDGGAIEAGARLYAANCAACHGAEAMGDGPAANSLNPRPRPLAMEMKALQDDYLFWRIAEGGAFPPFSSAMPAWKTILSEEQMWQVVAFLRSLAK